ncbi:hypothetical protein CLPU_6c01000 [Gottschalkia purinilytica]|uniref:DUF364 domain-containing protein n=1 Tax=Gottschalkia purinilytica TaxID=1503 RepID=A0A0L0WAS1_GOTPU|nr:DUF364 domain-containing protein [Gottschalkia purinilytica]KNF08614.1 hypothetical protein CLPU_6c01000 [Gottschalkia purinilytica]
MWEIYDKLIEPIPEDIYVEDCIMGLRWTYIKGKNSGIALTFRDGLRESSILGKIKGMRLKELSTYVKSWNFTEASLGLSAINSFYNTVEHAEKLGANFSEGRKNDIFTESIDEIRGKNVAVIGHFPDLEKIESICNLSILERRPSKGDLPDCACEYILKNQDFVFITGSTLANKTLPRLLELSKNAKVILVGPSVPVAPILFDYGVNTLASAVIVNDNLIQQAIKEGGSHQIFDLGGKMAKIKKKD